MKQIEGTARRVLRESKPLAVFWGVLIVAMLAYIFFTRDTLSSGAIFGGAAMLGAFLGMVIAMLLKDIN